MLSFIGSEIDTSTAFSGSYDFTLVILSLFAAYLGAFSGLAVMAHVRQHEVSTSRKAWLLFGAIVLGNGVFAMHFIGMLAYKLPISVRFGWELTALSGLFAMLASGWMLHRSSRQ